MEKRSPRHRAQVRERFLVGAVHIHRPHLGPVLLFREATPTNLFPIRAEKGPPVVTPDICQALHVRAIGLHQVDVHQPRLLPIKFLLRLFGQGFRVGVAVGSKGDPPAIRTVAALGIVAAALRQVHLATAINGLPVDIVVLIVVPGITLLFSLHPVLQLRRLQVRRGGVGMGGSIEEVLSIRMQPGAGRLASAIGKAGSVAGFEVEQENLVERVRRIALALENHAFSIRAEITLPGAFA